ncbi:MULTISPECIES: glutamine-hydrolyzing GMP synthase [Brevibacillus]|uniref:GMP synthase [glutamine-hydrolyzing] n=1 Tax=Brevibacillus borstelensis AK1 TaxID=1300222 RepID=M8DXZ3_9BACL|nr:glutamine-hydrolyzing GMP synthase [Brevibacillus borstelensis]EMT51896.1 GMP synthase [Brevibacillus borstelensis AK1]KKX56043.1 GMP synthase [Brevibacillus borstelensis cifa_chp40]MBE5398442.1 glutamine-hydrolyzing GMP synthase [Brevibacillus borstelensis]MCC0565914.1 glutamine-hydrolyzing GMP synthase [Brevibacillus borstelensis]MCM3473083.1 glutamine-hydrolyzing GMP synthase [Brevibacillus borstelensis]
MSKPMEMVVVLDFGGQYNQLIARRVRDLGVYSELVAYNTPVEKIKEMQPKGIIFSGGPASVYEEGAPKVDPAIFDLDVPVLGICYGMQLMSHMLEGKVERAGKREYGKAELRLQQPHSLYEKWGENEVVWMSHSDKVVELPAGFRIDAVSDSCPVAAISHPERKLYGVQFHPEVRHTVKGNEFIANFLFEICGCEGNWSMTTFIDDEIKKIRETVGDKKVLCALSGGVDSSVVAALIHKAIGDQLTCMFVDHGLLRKGEAEGVMETFANKFSMNVIKIDARERFLNKLKGVTDPEQKRKIIGNEFIYVFDEEASKLKDMDFLAQGTLYTDIVESGTATAHTIKSHHNVGGLPEDMTFTLIEPLKTLFKDEVRKLGTELGLPDEIVWRQPFPGPGLGIRVLGEVTEEKLEIVRESDAILREEIAKAGLDREIWQYFTALPDMKSVGVMGDVRTYSYTVGIRAVTSIDGMTADWARIPWDLLEKISTRIVNEVENVNRVVYDITSKPPATIEWE